MCSVKKNQENAWNLHCYIILLYIATNILTLQEKYL